MRDQDDRRYHAFRTLARKESFDLEAIKVEAKYSRRHYDQAQSEFESARLDAAESEDRMRSCLSENGLLQLAEVALCRDYVRYRYDVLRERSEQLAIAEKSLAEVTGRAKDQWGRLRVVEKARDRALQSVNRNLLAVEQREADDLWSQWEGRTP